ncbi:hypothetical protein EET67_05055 [Pseudaminobacter arsenicus]|uniref:Uncharacterized protein n=1 Tax=Borborobacter arsenicus TaxID=1851146 RepID=A0A432VA01_9HYPH|nr:hypothetical protein [Pseudaminobacter arsenicus]RUM99011.1 hypothetical protein EET67_05055 [Pseudaminobacter arsenicus]
MTDTKRMREIADLDSRAGAPVGDALRAAADRIDELEGAVREILSMNHKEQGANGIVVAQRIAKIAMGLRGDTGEVCNDHLRHTGASR